MLLLAVVFSTVGCGTGDAIHNDLAYVNTAVVIVLSLLVTMIVLYCCFSSERCKKRYDFFPSCDYLPS